MSERRRSTLATVAGTVVALLLAGAIFVFSGVYDVAADREHTKLTSLLLEAMMSRSVAARAKDVPEPPAVDSAALAEGFGHYRAMCVECHGAPGVDRGEVGRGLSPTPPDLSEEAGELGPAKLFWVTKHGIKFTGMPAFGPTHSDEEIWGIVAFLGRLAEMEPDEYAAWVGRYSTGGTADGGHVHEEGTPDHSH